MNPTTTTTTTQPTAPPPLPPSLPPPQPPLQPHRPSTSCDRHPQENFTGFCPSCLCERLAVLDPNSSAPSSSSSARKPPTSSTAAAALRAIFKPSSAAARSNNKPPSSELRRTKSFSASKNEGFSGVFEPQRKSCDVRVRSTLWNLFHHEASRIGGEVVDNTRNIASTSSVQGPVIESKEEEEEKQREEEEKVDIDEEDEEGIRVFEEPNLGNVIEERVQEIVEEEEEEEEQELKTMKDHIDLDSQAKKTSGGRDFKEIAGSFFAAASVFSKKLQKWRQKQKMKKRSGRGGGGGGSATLPVEKPIGRQFRETQSEIADYGFGRRSCDTDPRFSLDVGRMSLDAGRISLDDPRYSFDEPRASWDGYLIGRTTFPRMPPMLSVVEDAPVHVLRSDTQIPVEEPANNAAVDEDFVPGGTTQTREYYDSTSRRRKSLDRSNSVRKAAAAIMAGEMDESKVSPAATTTVDPIQPPLPQPPKAIIPDRILRDSNSNSLRDDCSDQTFELGFQEIGAGDRKSSKKSRRWGKAWNIWGLINRKGGNGNKEEEEDRYSRANNGSSTERLSFSESWTELGSERIIGDARNNGFNPKMLRSNSSVSWRNTQNMNMMNNGSFGGSMSSMMRKNGFQGRNHNNGRERDQRDEFVLERNRSARYSTDNTDNGSNNNGLFRLYVNGGGGGNGGWRNVGSSGKTRSNQAHSIARSVLRLY